jgi:inosine/xanthosine triphosphatase
MRVVVGSTNPRKIESVERAFKLVWPNKSVDVVGVKAQSGVAEQPMSTAETIAGARNRARHAEELEPEADFWVGQEGGLCQLEKVWHERAWMIVRHKQQEGMGSTVSVEMPQSIMKHIAPDKDIGYAVQQAFGINEIGKANGIFGFLTNNAVSRTEAYTHAVCMALAPFVHEDLF